MRRWLVEALARSGPYVVAVLFVAALVAITTCGCGPAAQQHRTLNMITDIADPTYELALEGCDAARDFIVAREGTTFEQDSADMARVNEVCDSVVFGFETLRGTQLTARAAIDNGLAEAAAEAVAEGLAAWARLQAMVPEIQRLATGGES